MIQSNQLHAVSNRDSELGRGYYSRRNSLARMIKDSDAKEIAELVRQEWPPEKVTDLVIELRGD